MKILSKEEQIKEIEERLKVLEAMKVVRKEALTINLLYDMLIELKDSTPHARKKTILSRRYKFDALLIIDLLTERGHIQGNQNSKAYAIYKYISDGLHLKTMHITDFSRTICKYFGFSVKVERVSPTELKRTFYMVSDDVHLWKFLDFSGWDDMSDEKKLEYLLRGKTLPTNFPMDDYKTLLSMLLERKDVADGKDGINQ